jgi:type II secretory pathway pseudopilin PulG
MRNPWRRHHRNRTRSRTRNGYIAADAVIALGIVLILLTVLSVSVGRQRRGSERLADSRAAIRLAEETITALQTGATPPAAPQGMTVAVRPAQAQGDLQPPAGSTWVDVVVSYNNGRSSSLSGLVRAEAAKGAIK